MLAQALERDPDVKRKKLTDKDSKSKMIWKGFFIRTNVDWETGIVVIETVKGILSPAFLEAYEHPVSSSRNRVLKRHIESGFEPPIGNNEAAFNTPSSTIGASISLTRPSAPTSWPEIFRKCLSTPLSSQLLHLISSLLRPRRTLKGRLKSSASRTCSGLYGEGHGHSQLPTNKILSCTRLSWFTLIR
jgi:hypothetical protein